MDKFLASKLFFNVNKLLESARSPCLVWRSLTQGKRDLLRTPFLASCMNEYSYRQIKPSSNTFAERRREWQLFEQELRSFHRMLTSASLSTRSQIQHTSTEWTTQRHYSTESSDKDSKKESSDPPWGKKPPNMHFLAAMLIATLVSFGFALAMISLQEKQNQVTWEIFVTDLLLNGEVHSVEIPKSPANSEGELIYIKPQPGARVNGVRVPPILQMRTPTKGWFEQKLRDKEEELKVDKSEQIPVTYTDSISTPTVGIASYIMLWLSSILWLAIFLRMRKLGLKGPTKKGGTGATTKPTKERSAPSFDIMSPFKMKITRGDEVDNPKFKDVAGLREAKIEIQEFVEYLKTPQRFKDIGAKIPRGALLLGPPGCGKTFIAKALAGESEVPFLALSGTDFIQMIGGLGAKRVRDLFKEARSCAPCIVYIDEIDTIGRKRGARSVGSDEFDQTLNQLLTEMDGMQTTEGVIVLASTNRSQVLDDALLRPGRLDRHILIDLPTLNERIELYELYLAKLTLGVPLSLLAPKLAMLTPGMTGADIANICNEAAIHAAREMKKEVGEADLFYAVDRVNEGPEKKSNTLGPETRKVVAFHEGGHAIVGWMLQTTDDIAKVSILARAGKTPLAFNRRSRADHKLYSKEYLFEQMCYLLGGRAAEAIIFNKVTDGGEDDLRNVTDCAYKMVKEFGMNEKIGPLSFQEEGQMTARPYSDYLQNIIDIEAKKLINQAYRQTEELLNTHKDKLTTLAEALLEKETLSHAEIELILGPPPFAKKSTTSGISLDIPIS